MIFPYTVFIEDPSKCRVTYSTFHSHFLHFAFSVISSEKADLKIYLKPIVGVFVSANFSAVARVYLTTSEMTVICQSEVQKTGQKEIASQD